MGRGVGLMLKESMVGRKKPINLISAGEINH